MCQSVQFLIFIVEHQQEKRMFKFAENVTAVQHFFSDSFAETKDQDPFEIVSAAKDITWSHSTTFSIKPNSPFKAGMSYESPTMRCGIYREFHFLDGNKYCTLKWSSGESEFKISVNGNHQLPSNIYRHGVASDDNSAMQYAISKIWSTLKFLLIICHILL